MADVDRREFDFEFRPESYWESADAIFANVKGEWRRKKIRRAVEDGSVDEVPPEVFADSLDDKIRRKTGAIHPSMMGGEYLPDYLPAEIEVARISLRSTTGDVIALRARPEKTGIAFRWSDEYEEDGGGQKYVIRRHGWSQNPLSLDELIELFKSTTCPDYQHNPGANIIEMFRNDQWDEWGTPEEAVGFASMGSAFYPELAAWYDADSIRWYREKTQQVVYEGPLRPGTDHVDGEFVDLVRLAQFARRCWPKPFSWSDVIDPSHSTLQQAVHSGDVNPANIPSFEKLKEEFRLEIQDRSSAEKATGKWVTVRVGIVEESEFRCDCEDLVEKMEAYAFRNDLPLP